MDAELTQKNFPASTPEVLNMLGLAGASSGPASAQPSHNPVPLGDLPIANLPVAHQTVSERLETIALTPSVDGSGNVIKILKTAAPYATIFFVGIFLYYFFFSAVNFNSVLKTRPAAV